MARLLIGGDFPGPETREKSEVQSTLTSVTQPIHTVQCPMCEYDMRGLAECRCPECGFASTWDELTDPTRARHPYLFEHHPQRNMWSAIKTFAGGFRPRRFWTGIYPTQPLYPRRLVLYGLLCNAVTIGTFMLLSAGFLLILVQQSRSEVLAFLSTMPPAAITRRYGSLEAALRAHGVPTFAESAWKALSNRDGPFVILAFVTIPALWSWLTFASLMVYQHSMRRARLKPAHLLRAAIYSCDAMALIGVIPLLCLFHSGQFVRNPLFAWARGFAFDGVFAAAITAPFMALLIACCSYRLWQACRRYLQFRFALAAVIASQILVLLMACCIVFIPDLFLDYIPVRIFVALDDCLHLSGWLEPH